MATALKRCKNCKHVEIIYSSSDPTIYQCRIVHPEPAEYVVAAEAMRTGKTARVWPVMSEDDWCNEWHG